MRSTLKIGLSIGLLVAIAIAALTAYFWDSPATDDISQTSPKQTARHSAISDPLQESKKTAAENRPVPNRGIEAGASLPRAAGTTTTVTPAEAKVLRIAQRAERAQAMREMSELLAKREAVTPKEVYAALDRIEKTIPSAEGKQQIALARQTYDINLKIQALAQEFTEVSKSTKPESKQRKQEILAEITSLQQSLKNATDATKQYAASALRPTK
jgi:hypothetical protein